MRPSLLLAFAASLPALAACAPGAPRRPAPASIVDLALAPASAPAPAAPTTDAAGEDDPDDRVFLVWARGGEAPPTTFTVAGDGSVLRAELGIVIAGPRGLWSWEEAEEALATVPCDIGNGPAGERGEGKGTRAAMVLRGGAERQEVVTPPEGGDANEIGHGADVLASVGPYLFIRESTYVYACGAHGGSGAEFHVWDLERGATLALLEEVPDVPALQQTAAEALAEGEGEDEERDLPELTMITPAYQPGGRLRWDAQLTGWACYACSDGLWSSYSRSAVVPTTFRSGRFAPWANLPSGVMRFLAQRKDLTLGGWSIAAMPGG